jgi:hypothetical protein
MAAKWGKVSARVVLATSLGIAARTAEAQTMPPSLTVVIHSDAAVPSAVLEDARAIATKIYRRIDVKLDWSDRSHLGTEVPTDPAAPEELRFFDQFAAGEIESTGHGFRQTPTTLNRAPLDTGDHLPPNLKAGVLQPTVELMWRSSPTFRSQCARLAAEPTLQVSLWIEPFHPIAGERAHTEISRVRGRLTHADIVFFDARDAVELIAHEMEHIIEQIDGVHLQEAVCGITHTRVSAHESCRAIEIGRRVAREVEESRATFPLPSRD